MNHHGQEVCRLSLGESIIERPVQEKHWAYRSVSRLLFKIPDTFLRNLEKLWADEFVNVHQWRQFGVNSHTEWKACLFIVSLVTVTSLLYVDDHLRDSPF